jgi:hypothetical protein
LQNQWYTDIQNLVLPPAVAPPGETEAERKIRVARRAEILALKEAAAKAAVHAGTPTLMHTDTLARPFYTIQHNRYPDNNNNPVDQIIRSYVNLDIQGNRLSVVDGYRITAVPANDPLTLQYRYNMLQGISYQLSIDSGLQRMFTDIAGQPLYAWDAAGQQFHMTYDTLRRMSGKYVAGRRFEKMVYGESYSITNPKTMNLRGALLEHYDSSGKQALPDGYDFKGNPVATAQQLLLDKLLGEVDWDNAPPGIDPETFYSDVIVDAGNRKMEIFLFCCAHRQTRPFLMKVFWRLSKPRESNLETV